jgi:GTP cyclohydrolase II
MIIALAERQLKTKYGVFKEMLYYYGRAGSIALVMGNVAGGDDILCRVHSACIGGHVFNSTECECAAEMAAAQTAISDAGRGVIIYLDQEGKGNGHLALIQSIPFKGSGFSQGEAYKKARFKADARSFRPAAEILTDLKVKSVVLITNNPEKVAGLHVPTSPDPEQRSSKFPCRNSFLVLFSRRK